ncbi:DinB family protein [Aurantibacter sp.]|uniref:DinB family protein n=1 Tax=Aurantibacter sp. TaxID=2807103 RepID=UPI0032658BC0
MSQQEFWLSGPIAHVPVLLQPSAHALLQSVREIKEYLIDFPEEKLWLKPFGRAAIGFHLQHLTGVLDRMLTYAQGKPLSTNQFEFLKNEGNATSQKSSMEMIVEFESKVQEALSFFKTVPESSLTEVRTVGRKKLPSTVIGLLFHAAEHSQRHVGQLLVTISALKE